MFVEEGTLVRDFIVHRHRVAVSLRGFTHRRISNITPENDLVYRISATGLALIPIAVAWYVKKTLFLVSAIALDNKLVQCVEAIASKRKDGTDR